MQIMSFSDVILHMANIDKDLHCLCSGFNTYLKQATSCDFYKIPTYTLLQDTNIHTFTRYQHTHFYKISRYTLLQDTNIHTFTRHQHTHFYKIPTCTLLQDTNKHTFTR